MLIRANSSLWMIGGFALIIYLGHLYIWLMVVVIQIFMAKELFNLLRRAHEDKQLPGFRHFFFTAMLFVYGRILSQRLMNTVVSDKILHKFVSGFVKYHMVTCYTLYTAESFISGVLLCAEIYPLCFAVVQAENSDNWAWFFGEFETNFRFWSAINHHFRPQPRLVRQYSNCNMEGHNMRTCPDRFTGS